MKKEFKVNGKVTYPQGVASRTTYTLIGDAVSVTIEKEV